MRQPAAIPHAVFCLRGRSNLQDMMCSISHVVNQHTINHRKHRELRGLQVAPASRTFRAGIQISG